VPSQEQGVLGWPRLLGILACCAAYATVLCLFPHGSGVNIEALSRWRVLLAEIQVLAVACVVISVAARLSRVESPWHIAALILAAPIGVVAGCLSKVGWSGWHETWRLDPVRAATLPIAYLGVAWLGAALWLWHQREAKLREALHAEQMRRSELERQVAEAQLQALQAQVEPHFLFNTLAHLRRLYVTEPVSARKMLRDLSHFLQGLQPALHRSTIPVSEEVEYARAYLKLQRSRMGSRLRYRIDLEPETLAIEVPPLAVTTLVENAVKHGLANVPDGGTITISATRRDGLMHLDVVDDGVGLRAGHGAGVGLANLRARLRSSYGMRAGLELRQSPPGGVVARITVPYTSST
jgi:signal transduction histidine kinase